MHDDYLLSGSLYASGCSLGMARIQLFLYPIFGVLTYFKNYGHPWTITYTIVLSGSLFSWLSISQFQVPTSPQPTPRVLHLLSVRIPGFVPSELPGGCPGVGPIIYCHRYQVVS